jgi:hypothetical protein
MAVEVKGITSRPSLYNLPIPCEHQCWLLFPLTEDNHGDLQPLLEDAEPQTKEKWVSES